MSAMLDITSKTGVTGFHKYKKTIKRLDFITGCKTYTPIGAKYQFRCFFCFYQT